MRGGRLDVPGRIRESNVREALERSVSHCVRLTDTTGSVAVAQGRPHTTCRIRSCSSAGARR